MRGQQPIRLVPRPAATPPQKVAYQILMGGGWVGNFIFFTISI